MLVSHALPFRPVVQLQLDVWDVSQTFASEICSQKKTGYCGLASPSLFSSCKKAHVKLSWRWSSSLCLPEMRIEDLNIRRRIVAAVALTPGKTAESGITRDEKKTLDYSGVSLSPRNPDGSGSIWIGAGAPSPISGNGSFAVALTVLPTQQGGLSNSPQNNGTFFLSEKEDYLHSAEHDTLGILPKEEAPSNSREQYRFATSPELDVATVGGENSRRKKISEANKGRTPWNKGKKFPQGVPQSLRTALPIEEIGDLDDSSNLLMLEKQRRQRISQANKGKVPWNKGRKHSEETKQRIRTRTTEAMKDPKIREKLRIHGEMQSPETRSKIRAALLKLWCAKKKFTENQETCCKEWKEMIAEAARRGDVGDEETHQWDSYSTIVQEMRDVWRLSMDEERKRRRRAAAQSRTNRTSDHRSKISEAIKSKWNDPNYRLSVQRGIYAHLLKRGIEPCKGRPRRAHKRANTSTIRPERQPDIAVLNVLSTTSEEKSVTPEPILAKVLPVYKNPLTVERLEKLKQIRASRLSEEIRRKEVTERARILMAEAKRAARALEAAAVKDKNALAPLLETRRLLAEAARSFETAGLGKQSSLESWRREGSEERWRIHALSSRRLVDYLNLQHEVPSTKAAFICFSTVIVNNFLESSVWMTHNGMSSISTNGMARAANCSLTRRRTRVNS